MFSLPAWGAWGWRRPRAAGLLPAWWASFSPSEPRVDTQAGLPWSPHKRQVRAEQEAPCLGGIRAGRQLSIYSMMVCPQPCPSP